MLVRTYVRPSTKSARNLHEIRNSRPFQGQFGPILGYFGLFWEVWAWIWAIYGQFRGSGDGFGPFWTYLRGSGPISRSIWTKFRPFWAHSELFWRSEHGFGPSLANFWVLGMDLSHSRPIQWVWAYYGPILGGLGMDLVHFWPILGFLSSNWKHKVI